MYRYLTLILLSTMVYSSLSAQQLTPDSLERWIKKEASDEKKIVPLSSLSIYYFSYGDPKGLEYAKEAVRLAKQQSDNKYGVYSYSCLAAIYADMDSLALAYTTADTCMRYIERTSDVAAKISGLNSMVIIKEIFNEKESIPDLLLQGIELTKQIPLEQIQGRWELETKLYLSLYYYYLGLDPMIAKTYLDKSLEAVNKIDAPSLKFVRFNSYNDYYKTIYEKELTLDMTSALDSSLNISNTAMSFHKAESGRIGGFDYAKALYNRADIYFMKNQLDSAIFYADRTIEYCSEISDKSNEMLGYSLLSKIESKKNNLQKAEYFIEKALELISEETGNYEDLYNLHTDLSNIYNLQGNYQQALAEKEKAFGFYQKEKSETYLREAQIANAKYKVQQSKFELEQAQKENEIYFLTSIAAIVLLAGLVMLVFLYRLKLKNSQQKERILLDEKDKANLKKQVLENEAVKLAVEKRNIELQLESEKNKALLKAYEVNKLQKELLAGNLHLGYKNEVIRKIKTQIGSQSVKTDISHINNLLKDDSRNDEKFEEFSTYVKKIHPTFYTLLQNKASQNLTQLDLKYCTFIFMNLSSKEIASLLYIEPKTVRMTKYRLKQKLSLSKEEDLTEFIRQLI